MKVNTYIERQTQDPLRRGVEFSGKKTIQQLFEEQVEKSPGKIAAVFTI